MRLTFAPLSMSLLLPAVLALGAAAAPAWAGASSCPAGKLSLLAHLSHSKEAVVLATHRKPTGKVWKRPPASH